MKTVLEGDGYTVEVATCAAQARAALDRAEYQVLLLDLGLPDADGLELLRELRQRLLRRRRRDRAYPRPETRWSEPWQRRKQRSPERSGSPWRDR